MLTDFVRLTDMDVFMLAGRYTLLEQSALDELLPTCEAQSVGIVAREFLTVGSLSSAPADDAKYNYGDAPKELLARARRIAQICEHHGTTLRRPRWPFLSRTRGGERLCWRTLASTD